MSEERDWEKEALADGWNPNYEGENKVDAKTFVERGEKINGLLKGKIGRLEERIDSLTQANAEFKKYTDGQLQKEKDRNKQLIADLEEARAQAITDGDGKAAVQAEREIRKLEKVDDVPPTNLNPMQRQWLEENPWYDTNPKLTAFANGIADQVVAQGYTGQAYFTEISRQVQEAFPGDFKNPNRDKPGSVEDGGTKEVKDSKAKTFANLPKEAQEIAKRFEKEIPGFDRKEYVANYEWE